MRKRTKMSGLVSHTIPTGASYQSGRNKCEQGLKKIEKAVNDGWKLTEATVKKQPKQVVVSLGGDWTVTLSVADYKQRGKGLKVIMEIF